MPWLPAVLIAGLVAMPVGAIVAIPAIRLSGLFLALATLGFGIMVRTDVLQARLHVRSDVGGLEAAPPGFVWVRSTRAATTTCTSSSCSSVVIIGVVVAVLTETRLGRLLRAISRLTARTHHMG